MELEALSLINLKFNRNDKLLKQCLEKLLRKFKQEVVVVDQNLQGMAIMEKVVEEEETMTVISEMMRTQVQ